MKSEFCIHKDPFFLECMLILPLNSVFFNVFSSTPPKIVFNRLNGKRYHGVATHKTPDSAEGFTQAHEENVRFVYEGKGPTVGLAEGMWVESQRSDLHGCVNQARYWNVSIINDGNSYFSRKKFC